MNEKKSVKRSVRVLAARDLMKATGGAGDVPNAPLTGMPSFGGGPHIINGVLVPRHRRRPHIFNGVMVNPSLLKK